MTNPASPSLREIARLLGVDHKAVSYWRDRGMDTSSLASACRFWIQLPITLPYTQNKVDAMKRAHKYLGLPNPKWLF